MVYGFGPPSNVCPPPSLTVQRRLCVSVSFSVHKDVRRGAMRKNLHFLKARVKKQPSMTASSGWNMPDLHLSGDQFDQTLAPSCWLVSWAEATKRVFSYLHQGELKCEDQDEGADPGSAGPRWRSEISSLWGCPTMNSSWSKGGLVRLVTTAWRH